MNIYELTDNYLKVLELAEEGNIEDYQDTLDMLTDDIELKAEGYAKVIKSLEADVMALDTEIKRLNERKAVINNNISRLKENLFNNLKRLDKTKVKTALFNVTIAKNPVSLQISDEAIIPNEYYIPQEPKLDKTKLKNDVKAGIEIKGCTLIQTEGLRIK